MRIASLGAIDVTRLGALARLPHVDTSLLVAPIVGEGVCLGALQRARSTVDVSALEGSGWSLVRRATGGPALRVGRGQVYVALDLPVPEALRGVADPNRALNRHVRPLLAALTSLGDIAATSGGRELVLMKGEPVAFVAIGHHRASRRTWLEAIVAVDSPFALPEHLDLAHGAIAPRFLGKHPTTLSAVLQRAVDPREVADLVARAYGALAGGLDPFDPPPLPQARVDAGETPFAAMIEEAIGLLGAVVERERVFVGGDLMVSIDAVDELSRALFALGPSVDDAALFAAIDGALAPSSGAMILGVRSLQSIARLVRAAWAATKT